MISDTDFMSVLIRMNKLENQIDSLWEEINKLRGQSSNTVPAQGESYFIDTRSTKDKTRYILDDDDSVKYGKAKLVLTAIKRFVDANPRITYRELKKVFPDEIQGGVFGCFQEREVVLRKYHNKIAEAEKRFFMQDKNILHLVTGDCVVSSQWSVDNINNFIDVLKQLGFNITEIKRN